MVITLGLGLLKYLPMAIWGDNILFDASAHIASAMLALYVAWFFVDQNKQWRVPFFLFCVMVLTVIALQRIIANAHNDVGLLLGLMVGLTAIGIAERKRVLARLRF